MRYEKVTAGRRQKKKAVVRQTLPMLIYRCGGFEFQSRRFFALAQTNDDLHGCGSQWEVILPCLLYYFVSFVSCASQKKFVSAIGVFRTYI